MEQVSEEISLGPPSGRPRYNLDDYIKERDPYEEGEEELQGREIERKREWEYCHTRTSVNHHLGLKSRSIVKLISNVYYSIFLDLYKYLVHIPIFLH